MVWWGVQQAGEERDGPCGECSRRGAGRVMRERRREHVGAAVRPVWTVVIEGGGGISDGDSQRGGRDRGRSASGEKLFQIQVGRRDFTGCN